MSKDVSPSRKPEALSRYNRRYYRDNYSKLSASKRLRYATDTEYREKIKARARQQCAERARNRPDGVYREYNGKRLLMKKIGAVADAVGVTTYRIIDWEAKGLVPKHIVGKSRVYTPHQVQLIALARDAVREQGTISKAVASVGAKIKAEWLFGV